MPTNWPKDKPKSTATFVEPCDYLGDSFYFRLIYLQVPSTFLWLSTGRLRYLILRLTFTQSHARSECGSEGPSIDALEEFEGSLNKQSRRRSLIHSAELIATQCHKVRVLTPKSGLTMKAIAHNEYVIQNFHQR